jgi:hypothetical protein
MAVVEVLVYQLRVRAEVEQARDDRSIIGVEVEVEHVLVPTDQTDVFGQHDQRLSGFGFTVNAVDHARIEETDSVGSL